VIAPADALAWAAENGYLPELIRSDAHIIGSALGYLECAEDWSMPASSRDACVHKARMLLAANAAAGRQAVMATLTHPMPSPLAGEAQP
jgi:hypothetical protein